MKRIYEAAAYAPRQGCWWDDTAPPAAFRALTTDLKVDVAIVGAGFTGLSAAYQLAKDGVETAVFEAEQPGFGASGRNGGFCCLGGSKLSFKQIARKYGPGLAEDWVRQEKAAINTVEDLLRELSLDVDRHSEGEVILAHSPKAMSALAASVDELATCYGVTPRVIPQADLADQGLGGGFFGGLHIPLGFALNPGKYAQGLAQAAYQRGAQVFGNSPVSQLAKEGAGWVLTVGAHRVHVQRLVIATNGYSSEDVPDWMRTRYLPVQSSVIVTRPLSDEELHRQNWTSDLMAYDSRVLLHYFRKMPDNRFLFGMRGGLNAQPATQAKISDAIRQDFNRLFPQWADVDITHDWSGLVCLTAKLMPFVGAVPSQENLFAGFGFHGNGVAMGTHAGRILAGLVQGKRAPDIFAAISAQPMPRFPLGRFRRALLWPAYKIAHALDL